MQIIFKQINRTKVIRNRVFFSTPVGSLLVEFLLKYDLTFHADCVYLTQSVCKTKIIFPSISSGKLTETGRGCSNIPSKNWFIKDIPHKNDVSIQSSKTIEGPLPHFRYYKSNYRAALRLSRQK